MVKYQTSQKYQQDQMLIPDSIASHDALNWLFGLYATKETALSDNRKAFLIEGRNADMAIITTQNVGCTYIESTMYNYSDLPEGLTGTLSTITLRLNPDDMKKLPNTKQSPAEVYESHITK
jgi:hypothetical protein